MDFSFSLIQFVAGFKHTGPIENVNSLHNKYMPKLQVFSHEGALTRTALAAIGIKILANNCFRNAWLFVDHNSNLNRSQAVTKDGIKR